MNTPSPTTIRALYGAWRPQALALLILGGFILWNIWRVFVSVGLVDPDGVPIGYDFIVFWAASNLTLAGDAAAAFDPVRELAAQEKALTGADVAFYWHYPPTFQLLAAPLALAPYVVSYLVFIGLGFLAYILAVRPLLRQPSAMLLLAAFPPVLIAIYHGQNSLYSAALFAGAILLAERSPQRPWAAAAFIGLLAFKPQLGVLIPFALAAASQWRLFGLAAAATSLFAGAATLAFGPGLWIVFFDNLPFVRSLMETAVLPWSKMPSAFIFLRGLGVPETFAYAGQILAALAALVITVAVWRRNGMTRLSWAVLISATLLVTPYVFDYELTLLSIVFAILATDMAERGATLRGKVWLAILVLCSGITTLLTLALQVQVGFPLLLAVAWLACRRALPGGARLRSWTGLSQPA